MRVLARFPCARSNFDQETEMNKMTGQWPNKHVFYFLLSQVAGGPGVTGAVLCRGPFCRKGGGVRSAGTQGQEGAPLRGACLPGGAATHGEGPPETHASSPDALTLSLYRLTSGVKPRPGQSRVPAAGETGSGEGQRQPSGRHMPCGREHSAGGPEPLKDQQVGGRVRSPGKQKPAPSKDTGSRHPRPEPGLPEGGLFRRVCPSRSPAPSTQGGHCQPVCASWASPLKGRPGLPAGLV